jgi:hypothetical protein
MSPRKQIPKKLDKSGVAKIDVTKEIHAIARERVGTVKASRVIVDEKKEAASRKPKHKKLPTAEDE